MDSSGDDGNRCFPPLFLIAAATVIVLRLTYVFYRTGKPLRGAAKRLNTLIVLGSGGHTAEMLRIVEVLEKDRFAPRSYVAAMTDNMSLQKARVLEESVLRHGENNDKKVIDAAQFVQIYRSREVGQSYLTSVGTTLVAMVHAIWLIFKLRPQVVMCNGPGTCIPLCIAAVALKIAGIRWSSIFYIESIARVRRLSLSGHLLYKLHLADQFFVQWPQLQKTYPRAQYVGRLM